MAAMRVLAETPGEISWAQLHLIFNKREGTQKENGNISDISNNFSLKFRMQQKCCDVKKIAFFCIALCHKSNGSYVIKDI